MCKISLITTICMAFLGIFGKELSYSSFENWIDRTLSANIPNNIEAFCINIYEDGSGRYSIELIGADSFDKENSDWACDEVFTNREEPLKWKSNKSWKETQTCVEGVVRQYLINGKYASVLLSKKGIGVGFVDGGLVLLEK